MKKAAVVKADFKAIFPHLGREAEVPATFNKVHKFITGYAVECLGKKITEVDLFDLITSEKRVNRDFSLYASKIYINKSTQSSQVSVVKKLALAELELVLTSDLAKDSSKIDLIVNPDKLKPYMRELWLVMPRERGDRIRGEDRVKLPLTRNGKEIFKAILAVDSRVKVGSAQELLLNYYDDLRREIGGKVRRKIRRSIFSNLHQVVRKFGLSVKKGRSALSIEQLPLPLRENVNLFTERASLGFRAVECLRDLAIKHQVDLMDEYAPTTIKEYVYSLSLGAAYFQLDEGVSIRDLLLLEQRVDGEGFYNRYVERYRKAEKEVERRGFKRKHFDSVRYAICINAICAIARFNGIFDLQENFRNFHGPRLDRVTKKQRKRLKKAVMNCELIDTHIVRLKREFDEIVRKKSFLANRDDLMLCLFLPQLMTLRYLGYRQQCLRHCELGKNIKIGNGIVTFHYEPNEIKNEVLIHQELSKSKVGNVPQLLFLIKVLRKYKFQVLDEFRSRFPEDYERQMGDSFFAMPCPSDVGCYIRRFNVGVRGANYVDYCRDENRGKEDVYRLFTESADKFMDSDELIGFEHYLNPHFLRAICCDWMRNELGMTWDEISEAMGDSIDTLKREYAEERKRIQTSKPFERVSQDREKKERSAEPSVSSELWESFQKNFDVLSSQLKRAEERTDQAEEEATRLKEENKFLLGQLNLTPTEA
jgi:hypothetical protein